MKRLDWLLVPPPRVGKRRTDAIRAIEDGIGLLVTESRRVLLSEAQVDMIADLESDYELLTVSTCEAINAPRLKDSEDAQERLREEFEDEEIDEDFAMWSAERGEEFDCANCPFASPYSLYPVNPCEMNGGPLLEILADHPQICKQAQRLMTPNKMLALAALIDECLIHKSYQAVEGIDAEDYLQHARRFLTHWASLGFGLHADNDADADVHTPDGVLSLTTRRSKTILH